MSTHGLGTLGSGAPAFAWLVPVVGVVFLVLAVNAVVLVTRFKRCPPGKILVVYGKVGEDGLRCYHGGGAFVLPIVQAHGYLSAGPVGVDVEVDGTPSADGHAVVVRGSISFGVQTSRDGMKRAAKRFLGYPEEAFAEEVEEMARDVLRDVVAEHRAEALGEMRDPFERAVSSALGERLGGTGVELLRLRIGELRVGDRASDEA